jgi:hypothetical protein
MTKPSKDKRPVASAAVTPKSGKTGENQDVKGEGNYSASRRFDTEEAKFVERNKQNIPQMGKDAEKALDGPEGDELRKAEDRARGHSHSPGEER